MAITEEQRTAIRRDLSAKFANASGSSRMEHGVSQWEVLVDALVKTVEGIVDADKRGQEQDKLRPMDRGQ